MNKSKLLAGVAIVAGALPSMVASPATAAGTQAGTTITNEVTVAYQVNGIDQDDETAANDVVVDRKVDLTVARTDDVATEVNPGQASVAVTFTVENVSNDTLDFELAVSQAAGGAAAAISGTDTFDIAEASPFVFYLDDGNGVFDGGDTPVTHLDSLAPDTPVVVHAVGDLVPSGLATGDLATIVLTATAKENGNGSALGNDLVEAVANTAGVDTIFADGSGSSDGTRDAAFSAADDYLVLAAALTATKSSTIVAGDFGTGTALPGATIEYCITLSNAGGGAPATNITISDTLPGTVSFDTSYAATLNGVAVGGADCANPGKNAGSFNAGTGVVSGTIASLAAGASQTLIFRATID